MNGVGITYLWTSKTFPAFVRLEGKRGDYEVYVPERTCRVEREHVDVDGERLTDYSCGCFNQSGWGHNYCPNCGARVEKGDGE